MKVRLFSTIGLAALFLGSVLLFDSRDSIGKIDGESELGSRAAPAFAPSVTNDGLSNTAETTDNETDSKKATPRSETSKMESVRRRFRAAVPPTPQLSREIKQNPHTTPASLGGFARELETLLASALVDPAKAQTLFAELEVCALGGTDATRDTTALRVHCFRKLKRLASAYPEVFSVRSQQVRMSIDSAALTIVEALGD